MLGIRYLKTPPTTFTLQYRNGKVVRKGTGLSLFYYAPFTTLVQVNQASVDVPFVFEEVTSDFQDITIQGQLTFRVSDAETLVAMMNFAVDANGHYLSDDPEKLRERLIQVAQVQAHAYAQKQTMSNLLASASELSQELLLALRNSEVTKTLGVEVLALSVLSLKASPEMAKALQADAREKLLLKADEAIFARRNTAIELERQIKENELNTERAIEEKKREVRQVQMQADVAIEKQRAELVDEQVSNNRKLSAVQIESLRGSLEAMQGSDWKTILAAFGGGDAKQVIAMAFQQLAENAQHIGRLDISNDLLKSLIDDKPGKKS